ncbi:MAG: radical SAM protein [Planctomycetes bacterium]|nr:radical SAM protein [Planctomycetota bacterium]
MSQPVPAETPSARSDCEESRHPAGGSATPESPTGGAKHVELSRIHDFASKLCSPQVLEQLKAYVRWQAAMRGGAAADRPESAPAARVPDFAPVSINLDITTSCNYACDHCVDMKILNTGIRHEHETLLESLRRMSEKGLRSVIVIGGGEPTVYPKFSDAIRFMKSLGLQVAVVTNGSGMRKIAEVADCLDEQDWVRLSLDSGSDEVFQAMHKPKKRITLDEICEGVAAVKELSPRFKVGYSFLITWKGATINDTKIVANIHEIVQGAERAKRYGFDYISFKPFLTRAERNHAEIVDLRDTDRHFDDVISTIRARVDEAKKLDDERFKVYESTNLKVLENRSYRNYTQQPATCHMQFFRQVLSPLGTYNCPVYRNQPHGRIGDKDAYASEERSLETRSSLARLIDTFDASRECSEVTCLYNHVNWWIEDLIRSPEKLDAIAAVDREDPDYFL